MVAKPTQILSWILKFLFLLNLLFVVLDIYILIINFIFVTIQSLNVEERENKSLKKEYERKGVLIDHILFIKEFESSY